MCDIPLPKYEISPTSDSTNSSRPLAIMQQLLAHSCKDVKLAVMFGQEEARTKNLASKGMVNVTRQARFGGKVGLQLESLPVCADLTFL